MILGIIPARKGSEGIRGKNMVDLGGRPLLDYTLSTAELCRKLDRIVLTTNMPDAISWTRQHYRRIEAPFVRPEHLAASSTTSTEVVLHAIDFLKEHEGVQVDTIVLLQPTCPFRRVAEIDAAVRQFETKKLSSLIGVSRVWHHPSDYVQRASGSSDGFQYVFRNPAWKRRQDFPEVWFITGALYVCTTDYLRRTGGFCDSASHLYPMGDETMVDIDTQFDLDIARGLIATGAVTAVDARMTK